jgi:O-antigen ligase
MRASAGNRVLVALGFDPHNQEDRACFAPAMWLSAAFAVLPFLLRSWDADRSLPLALLPAVWCGWKISKTAHKIDGVLLAWAVIAMVISSAFSAHAARAFVMISAVGWVIAGGLVARNLSTCTAAVRLVLAGIAAGAVAGVVMVRLGASAGSMYFPIYWSARLFGAHQFAGALASLGILVVCPPSTRGFKILAAFTALIVWTGFAWSGSRAPAVGLASALVLWFWRGDTAQKRGLLLWVPALTLPALALSYSLGTPYPQLGWWDAFTRTAQASGLESVSSERTRFWSVTWHHALTSPWIGHGADSYLYIHPPQNGNQPHNGPLQWFLEYGLLGLLPLTALIARGICGLFAFQPQTTSLDRPYNVWACAALAGAAVYSFFDGVFYHMIIFMPVAVIAGFALGQRNPQTPSVWVQRTHTAGRALLLGALALLLLHNWLCMMLIKGRNVSPDSPPARILRAFPSTSYALRNWIGHWRITHPEAVMPWVKWAQEAAIDQGAYHVYAAQLYIWDKNYDAAEKELLACLGKVPSYERNDVLEVLTNVRRLKAEAYHAKRSPNIETH